MHALLAVTTAVCLLSVGIVKIAMPAMPPPDGVLHTLSTVAELGVGTGLLIGLGCRWVERLAVYSALLLAYSWLAADLLGVLPGKQCDCLGAIYVEESTRRLIVGIIGLLASGLTVSLQLRGGSASVRPRMGDIE